MSTSGFSHRLYYLLSIPHPCQRLFMHGFRIRSGVFREPHGLHRSLLRPLAGDMSAYACHRSIPPQAKYRCVNLVMRVLGSTNLSCRWATVGLLGYLFLRIFFISRINKRHKRHSLEWIPSRSYHVTWNVKNDPNNSMIFGVAQMGTNVNWKSVSRSYDLSRNWSFKPLRATLKLLSLPSDFCL